MTRKAAPSAAERAAATAQRPTANPDAAADTGAAAAGAADAPARLLSVLRGLARDSGLALAEEAISLDSRLETELGLDSLGRAELITRAERALGCRLPDEALLAPTGRDLLHLAQTTGSAAGATTHATAGAPPAGAVSVPAAETTVGGAEAAPAHAATLVDVLDWHGEQAPDRHHILLYDGDIEPLPISHAELRAHASRIAGGLRAAGLLPGDRVALMLPTGADYFASFFGVLLAGGVPVPIYPPARPSQLEDHLRRHAGILANAGTALLVTVPAALTVARLLRVWVPGLRRVVTPSALADAQPIPRPAAVRPDDLAMLQYTSGSTGQPKGVMLSHADLLANIRAMGEAIGPRPDDVFVSWLPLYHDMGLIGAWLGSLYYRVPLVCLSPLAFLARPRRWLTAIHRHRGTLSAAPNFAYELCLKHLRDDDLSGLDLSCWRWALNGAEPVSADTLGRFAERFGGCGLRAEALAPVYGLAEAAVGLSFPPADRGPVIDCIDREAFATAGRALRVPCDDAGAQPVPSCGRPLPGYRLRIVDAAGKALPERHEGRVLFQGPSATRGYYRNPQATAALIRQLDGEPWHDTGDRGYLASGELHVTGRVKDMIIRGGRNLYPYELEQAIGALPGVRKGCVVAFAAPDPQRGSERLVLVAETRERDPARRDTLAKLIRERAAEVLGLPPEDIVLAPPRAIPKTSSGKLRRGAARERWLAGKLSTGAPAPAWQLVRLALGGLGSLTLHFFERLPARLYAAYAWLLFGLLAPLGWLGIVAAPTLRSRWAFARTGVALLRRLALVPLEVIGREHIPAPGRPFVLVCNHQSFLDVGLLIQAVRRPMVFVAAEGLRGNPFVRWPLARLDTLFVDRFDLLRGPAEMHRFRDILGTGRPLGFFPEGTFRAQPGLLPFHMGAFIAAAAGGVPVLPVAIAGSRWLFTGTSFFPRWGRVRISIGSPLEPAGDDWQRAVQLRDAARTFIAAHCGEEHAPDKRADTRALTGHVAHGSETK
jgi:1-acyl-sn-glycerol-3-phosphate acyltransferase